MRGKDFRQHGQPLLRAVLLVAREKDDVLVPARPGAAFIDDAVAVPRRRQRKRLGKSGATLPGQAENKPDQHWATQAQNGYI